MGMGDLGFLLKHRLNVQCQVSGIVMAAVQLGEGSHRKDSNATKPFRLREGGKEEALTWQFFVFSFLMLLISSIYLTKKPRIYTEFTLYKA